MLENVPQLCCIILYIRYNGGYPSTNTRFSLIMSVLQIIAAILNYIVVHCPQCKADCHVILYQLEMKVEPKNTASSSLVTSSSNSSFPIELAQDLGNRIRRRKGRKSSLRQKICRALECNKNEIEIGYIQVNECGCIVNIVHYLIGIERSLRPLYEEKSNSINKEFELHFGFNQIKPEVNVIVTYMDKRTISSVQLYTQVSSEELPSTNHDTNKRIKKWKRGIDEEEEEDEEEIRDEVVNSPSSLSWRKTI